MKAVVLMAGRACLVLMAAAIAAAVPVHARDAEFTAREAIVRAVTSRMGDDVRVEVVSLDIPAGAPARFIEARPDPAARLGRPIQFTLVPERGSRVFATATLRVVAAHVVTRRPLLRGMTVGADDVQEITGEVEQVPMRALPSGEQVVGGRVLRPVTAAAVIVPGAVVVRRAIEPGDRITAIAMAGDVQVSAELTAADGGNPGDVIRVVNTGSRRSLRGRVIAEGLVEVGYAR
jgi:flagella basal body P-ring formation protein FlgA